MKLVFQLFWDWEKRSLKFQKWNIMIVKYKFNKMLIVTMYLNLEEVKGQEKLKLMGGISLSILLKDLEIQSLIVFHIILTWN